jgi:hypothetical protein
MLVRRGLFSGPRRAAGVRFRAVRVLLMASFVGARIVHAVVSFRAERRPAWQQEMGDKRGNKGRV